MLELNDEKDIASFDTLAENILNKPSNMIYRESKGKLYGVISMGDVVRFSQRKIDYVVINRKFTQIRPNEYMAARQMFHEKRNINAIPVVDEDKRLLWAYVRWNDSYDRNLFSIGKTEGVLKSYKCVVLVRPCEIFRERCRRFETFYKYLLSLGVSVKDIANGEAADYIDKAGLILFVDEDELRAIKTLVKAIRLDKIFMFIKFITCCRGQKVSPNSILKIVYFAGNSGILIRIWV